MTDPTSAFAKMVPGFDFLQGLVKNAGAAMPGVGQWVAPTLDPDELEKRIQDLRTVQYWLEQNARLLGTTIQALEVQRMTLSTLKTMNVSLGDLTDSLRIRVPEPSAEAAGEVEPPAASAPSAPAPAPAAAAAPIVPPGVADPMKWWGALTQQFTELAANAMKDAASDAAKNLAGAMAPQGAGAAAKPAKPAKPAAAKKVARPRTAAAKRGAAAKGRSAGKAR